MPRSGDRVIELGKVVSVVVDRTECRAVRAGTMMADLISSDQMSLFVCGYD